MKILMTLLICFYSALSPAHDELETIRDLLELYRPQSMEAYGKPISLSVQKSKKMNAFAFARFGSPELTITTGALEALNDDEALSTMCHEVGHLFGERLVWTISGLAVEGEADYFAGSCIVKFLTEVRGMSRRKAVEEALVIAEHEAVAFAEGRITWQKGYLDFYRGINRNYPADECRLLTVIHGIYEWKRPACWYNPNNQVQLYSI